MYISVHCSDSLLLQMLPFRIDSVDVGLNLVGCIVIGFSQFLTSLNDGGRKEGGGEGRGGEMRDKGQLVVKYCSCILLYMYIMQANRH